MTITARTAPGRWRPVGDRRQHESLYFLCEYSEFCEWDSFAHGNGLGLRKRSREFEPRFSQLFQFQSGESRSVRSDVRQSFPYHLTLSTRRSCPEAKF